MRLLARILVLLFTGRYALALAGNSSSGAVPSASDVGADLTFLFQNDLNWPTQADHNGTILISKSETHADALAACQVLNEALLTTEGVHFAEDMKSLLGYIAFQHSEFSSDSKFWVAASPATASRGCAAISLVGAQARVEAVGCDQRLPALCTQSAPHKRNIETDLSPQFQVKVKSKGLSVIGTRDHLSFRFLGIPFADPFTRFTYSKPFSTPQATISALTYGAVCAQGTVGSEDCLFLNVYTPFLPSGSSSSSTKALRPVLFWIHGGGFTGGEASDGIFDGGNMVSRGDVVVVSIQYRLGTLGFLALDDGVTNGNYGIADQITALQWVQTHIAAFGGDPSQVTIYGQSAGAGSVRALLASPVAAGLFQGAIAQSNLGGFGYAHTYTEYLTIQEEVDMFASALVESVGCSGKSAGEETLACLRGADVETLLGAPTAPRYIVVDGKFITSDHLQLSGQATTPAHARANKDVNVIFGWMRDDGADFIGSFPVNGTTLTSALLGSGLSQNVTNLVVNSTLFPLPQGSDALSNLFNLTSRIGTDGEFRCIDQATVIAAAKHSTFRSVFAYQFDRSYAGFEPIPGTCEPAKTAAFPGGDPSLPYYRCHSGELYYAFGTLGQDLKPFRDPAAGGDLLFSQVTVDAWASFARSGDPNPDAKFLQARGFTGVNWGKWAAVGVDGGLANGKGNAKGNGGGKETPLRILDVPSSNSGWLEEAQCDLLGYPFNMFG
ncbi:hypothetical protein CVT25_006905 [Psilocybe cyanescens]|uniref:Carboxylesterase type B domain-containing protein n=1 Tax=Psilocybe cyanescens TaxID=93625 RepID=A0A409X653_PSICY|nr:hypothetical protein CVT25_006905 [Psilocybe cyanescens]